MQIKCIHLWQMQRMESFLYNTKGNDSNKNNNNNPQI